MKKVKGELLSHSKHKRRWMKRTLKKGLSVVTVEPIPIDGQELPSAADGWTPDKPKADPTLCVSAVTVIRMSDGSTRKFYRMSVPIAEVKQMKRRARLLARDIRREDKKAAKKVARSAAREFLFRMGKI